MAKKNSTGLEIVLSVESSDLIKKSKEIQKSISPITSELRAIESGLNLKFNASSFQRGMELAGNKVNATAQNVSNLKAQIEKLSKEKTDGAEKEIEQLSRELSFAEKAAAEAEAQLKRINQIALDNAKKQIEDLNKAFDKVGAAGKTMTATVTAPLIALGGAAFNVSADMAESLSKTEVVFAENADSVKKWADTTLESYGIANKTALEMASYFGDMAEGMGFNVAQATQMSKALVGLAGDIASFKNVGLDTAQAALGGIFSGETESLKRLGVVMTETNLQEYALSKGIETSYSKMSQAQKVGIRYQYVMETLANSQGDFARTSDSAANQLRILKESLTQLAATFGDGIAPMITPVIKNLNELVKWVDGLDEGTKKVVVDAALFAATLGPALLVTSKLGTAIASLIGLINAHNVAKAAGAAASTADAAATTADTAAKVAQTGATNTATTAQTALNTAMAANPATLLVTVISTLVAVLGSLALTAALTADNTDEAAEAMLEYKSAVQSAQKAAEDSQIEVELAEKKIERFKELNSVQKKTAAQEAELKQLYQDINAVLPNAIKMVQSETGAYYELNAAIADVIASKKESIKLEALGEEYKAAYTASRKIIEKYGSEEELEKRYSEAGKDAVQILSGQKKGFLDYIFPRVLTISDAKEYKQLESDLNIIREAKRLEKEFENESKAYYIRYGNTATKIGKSEAETTTLFNEDFFAAATQTEKEEEKKAEEKVEDKRKEYLTQFEQYTRDVAALARKAADERIAALDAEAAAYDRLSAKEKAEKQLLQARNKLKYEADSENRRQLEQEIARLEKAQAEQEMKWRVEDEKKRINDQYNALNEWIERANQNASVVAGQTTSNVFSTAQEINISGLSESAAERVVQDAINKAMRKLLNLV